MLSNLRRAVPWVFVGKLFELGRAFREFLEDFAIKPGAAAAALGLI